MMEVSSKSILQKPENIGTFRKLNAGQRCPIPEIRQNRKPTDVSFLIILSLLIVFLVSLMSYIFIKSDLINRFTHGYDECGNVCGSNNLAVSDISCSGKNLVDKPFLRYYNWFGIVKKRSCVTKCSTDEEKILYKCFPSNTIGELGMMQLFTNLRQIEKSILLLSLIGFCLSVGMLFLFRYCPGFIVWTILIGSCLALILFTALLWHMDLQKPAIVFTIISLIILLLVMCMVKRIKLIIRLFQEAIKVTFGIPIILFEPILTIFANMILLALVFFLMVIIIPNDGFLQLNKESSYIYVPNQIIKFTMILLLVIWFWLIEFSKGCQQMVISGSIAAYYFNRKKASVSRSHIYDSFYNLFWFHLGTVAFGSLLITLLGLLKIMIRCFVRIRLFRCMLNSCISRIDRFLKYFSKQAYILTAIHGQDFYKSGKRAVNLLSANAITAIAINYVGDYVLLMAKILIVVSTILIGFLLMGVSSNAEVDNFLMHNNKELDTSLYVAICIAAVITAIIAHYLFVVFEIAIDTIFLCYCEDKCMNNGTNTNSKYYMPASFQQYIDEVKRK